MTSAIDYALLAGASYFDTRDAENRFGLPQNWRVISRIPSDRISGFEASAFTKGTEIVISYSGTDPNNWNLFTTPDGKTNAALYAGKWADQLMQAAEYYLQIKATNPLATKITLTGHSLGGGLAALVGVFFDVRATTFDQAPFAASARFESSDGNWRSNAEDLLARLSAKHAPEKLTGFTEYVRLLNLNIFSNVIPRADRVDTIRVDKEILQNGLGGARPFGNPDVTLKHGSATGSVAGDDLHSQALLAAFLQSGDTPTSNAADHTLGQVSFKLTDLLKMFFDKNLFATDAATREKNFLDHLVRHEAGVRNPATGAISIGADAMVTRFTQDMWKLARDGGMTMSDGSASTNWLSKALIAFAMQKYYDEAPTSVGVRDVLFNDAGQGGIQFDFNAVAASLDRTKDAQSTGYFKRFLDSDLFTANERTLIIPILPVLRDWTIQAGAQALNTADTLNRNAFLLGGNGSDGLVGGSGTDLLIGNGGADLLQGKAGNDILLGGAGNDTYVYTTGDGVDSILDSGDRNTLAVDGDILSGGAEYGDARVHRSSDGKHLYVRTDANTLLIDGNILIKNYATGGSFNLTLSGAAAQQNPQTTAAITGDIKPDDTNASKAGIQAVRVDGKLVGTAQPYEDILVGTAANEHIRSGALDDNIFAHGGDDWIEAGAGRDYVFGHAGNDLIEGGQGSDIPASDANDDAIYGNVKVATADAIAKIELLGFIQGCKSWCWWHGEYRGIEPVGNDAAFEIGEQRRKYFSRLIRLAAEPVAWSNQKPWSVRCFAFRRELGLSRNASGRLAIHSALRRLMSAVVCAAVLVPIGAVAASLERLTPVVTDVPPSISMEKRVLYVMYPIWEDYRIDIYPDLTVVFQTRVHDANDRRHIRSEVRGAITTATMDQLLRDFRDLGFVSLPEMNKSDGPGRKTSTEYAEEYTLTLREKAGSHTVTLSGRRPNRPSGAIVELIDRIKQASGVRQWACPKLARPLPENREYEICGTPN